jgi:flagellar basal-body rod protein FlgC
MSLLGVFDVSASAINAQSMRLNVTASNLANAESVASTEAGAYRSRHPVFAAQMRQFAADPAQDEAGVGVRVLGIMQSPAAPLKRYQPDHPLADANGYVFASNVNPVEELTNMISASRSYQGNVEVMTTVRDLLIKTLSLGH